MYLRPTLASWAQLSSNWTKLGINFTFPLHSTESWKAVSDFIQTLFKIFPNNPCRICCINGLLTRVVALILITVQTLAPLVDLLLAYYQYCRHTPSSVCVSDTGGKIFPIFFGPECGRDDHYCKATPGLPFLSLSCMYCVCVEIDVTFLFRSNFSPLCLPWIRRHVFFEPTFTDFFLKCCSTFYLRNISYEIIWPSLLQ